MLSLIELSFAIEEIMSARSNFNECELPEVTLEASSNLDIQNNYQRGGGYRVFCGAKLLYRNSAGKLCLDNLDSVNTWVFLLDMYRNDKAIHSVLEHLMKNDTVIDPFKGVIDIMEDEYPMLIILHNKNNIKEKYICLARRTYFAKIDSRANQLTACFPLYVDEETDEVTMSLEPYYICKKKLPNNRYVRNHGGIWYTFNVSTEMEIESMVAYFDIVEAMKHPPTLYHAMYPQKELAYYQHQGM